MRVEQVLMELIDPDPSQPRQIIDPMAVEQLAGSINSHGQLQPAIVARMEKRFQLVDGFRRYSAAKLLGRKFLAAIVLDEVPTEDKRLILQVTANCLRSDLRPVEKARAFERLKSMNKWNNAELAQHLYISKSQVTLCLSHLTHSPEIQAKIDAGEISPSTAYAISRAPDETSRRAMLHAVSEGGLSRGDAVNHVKRRNNFEGNLTRMVCQLPSARVTIEATDKRSLDAIGVLLRKLGQQCRAAANEGYDIKTLESILADKCRRQSDSTTSSS